ncbi:pyrrolo-quinoline quinone, partial [bacterium]|nr:pyrrolo-quinoline quinone [bacterium]
PLIYKENIYFGTADGKFYCVDYKTGRQRWRFNTGGAITGTPVAANDMIYIGSSDHYLYAFSA